MQYFTQNTQEQGKNEPKEKYHYKYRVEKRGDDGIINEIIVIDFEDIDIIGSVGGNNMVPFQ